MTRVFWTDAEKQLIVGRAVDIRDTRPDLAGLGLLRQAIEMLPTNRQRAVVSLSQASWFEPALEGATKLREAKVVARLAESCTGVRIMEHRDDPCLSALGESHDHADKIEADARKSAEELATNRDRFEQDQEGISQVIALLKQIAEGGHKELLSQLCRIAELEIASSADERATKKALLRIDKTMEAVHAGQMTMLLILQSILQETTMLKHLAIGIPAVSEGQPHLVPWNPAAKLAEKNNVPCFADCDKMLPRRQSQ